MKCRTPVLAVSALLAVTCVSCGSDESGDDQPADSGSDVQVTAVAGGGTDPDATSADELDLTGTVTDLAARDGSVHALVYDGQARGLVTIESDGAVTRTPLRSGSEARHLAVGPDSTVHVADSDAVYRVEGTELVPEVVVEGADVPAADDAVVAPAATSIGGVAIDGEGRLIWTSTFIGTGPDEGSEPVMSKVYRLEDGQARHIAGAESADLEGEELEEMLASPPPEMTALEIPLDGYATSGELAAGDDGSVYVAGPASVLKIEPGGGVEAVLSDGERAYPAEPYGDAGEAIGFGGSWVESDIAVSGETLAVIDRFPGLDQETVDVAAFDWGDDLGAPAQDLADLIVRGLQASETVDAEEDTTTYGSVAVLVHDGQAATAMAHVSAVALDGDQLYAAGETAETGPESELLIVSQPVPSDWR